MTFENSKRLYKHYCEVGYDKAAEDLLSKYPSLKDGKTEGEKGEDIQSGDGERKTEGKSNTRKKK